MRSTINHVSKWHSRQAAVLALVASFGVRADDDDQVIAGYRARQEDLIQRSNAILAQADTEGRAMTEQERGEITDNSNEVENLEKEINLRQQVAAQHNRMTAPQARRTGGNSSDPLSQEPNQNGGGAAQASGGRQTTHVQTTHLSTPATRAAGRGNGGFNSFGHFAQAVRAASMAPNQTDQRLQAALTTYGNEGAGSDGGFLVPSDWRGEIMRMVDAEDGLLSRTDQQTITGNNISYPVDETTAWQSSGGVQAYWDGEASTINQSKPVFNDLTVKLHRLTAMVPMTEELLQDVPAMASYVPSKAGEKIAFKLNDAILNGNGVGMPLGIMNAESLVTVTKESSQVAGTFHADNAVKMMARMPASSFGRSVWLVNQDVIPFILKMGFAVTTASGTAVGGGALYLPPNGLANSGAYGSLLGRPIVVTEACNAVGTKGDVVLADLSKYLAAVKGSIKADVSMHLYFDQAVTAFRFILRMNGQPWLKKPIPRKGNNTNTLSHFIALENR